MGAIAIRGEIAKCHSCGKIAVLEGRGHCVSCYDKLVDAAPPIIPIKKSTKEKRREYSHRYYLKHKRDIQRRTNAYRNLRRRTNPEVEARERARERARALGTQHPCSICGNPCDRRALRCQACYRLILRKRGNRLDHPWRGPIGNATVTDGQIKYSNKVLILAARRHSV